MSTRVFRDEDNIVLILPDDSIVNISIVDFEFLINGTTSKVTFLDTLAVTEFEDDAKNIEQKSGLPVGGVGQILFYLDLISGVGLAGVPATQQEVNDGLLFTKYVTPLTNKNFKGVQGIFLNPTGDFAGTAGWADKGFVEDVPVLLFARNTTERAVFMFVVGLRAVLTDFDPIFTFIVYSTGAPIVTTGDAIRWQLEATYYEAGELASKPVDETLINTQVLTFFTSNADQGFFQFTLDRTLMTTGDRVKFTLSRIGGDAADNYSDDIAIGLSGLFIELKTTNP